MQITSNLFLNIFNLQCYSLQLFWRESNVECKCDIIIFYVLWLYYTVNYGTNQCVIYDQHQKRMKNIQLLGLKFFFYDPCMISRKTYKILVWLLRNHKNHKWPCMNTRNHIWPSMNIKNCVWWAIRVIKSWRLVQLINWIVYDYSGFC